MKAPETIIADSIGSIADVQGTDAIQALISASLVNQAVDSMADVEMGVFA